MFIRKYLFIFTLLLLIIKHIQISHRYVYFTRTLIHTYTDDTLRRYSKFTSESKNTERYVVEIGASCFNALSLNSIKLYQEAMHTQSELVETQ